MNKLRKWINRDDGRFYQVGNENLNGLEVIGGVLMICSFLMMVISQKNIIELPRWTTFTTLVTAVALFWLGTY